MFAERAHLLAQRCFEPALLLALAFCLAHALGPARYGSPDSATYLSAAEHLVHGDGYVTSTLDEHGRLEPLTCFAPLFALLIAADALLRGVSVRAAMDDIMVASFLLYALACYALLKELLPGALRRWAPVGVLAVLCMPGTVSCLRGALSDLLGSALALFACTYFLARAEAPRPRQLLIAGALFAIAICARWSNLYFALSASVCVLGYGAPPSLRQRAQQALTLTLFTSLLVAPLWLRNLLETGSAMGARPFAASNPFLHLREALLGLARSLLDVRFAASSAQTLGSLYLALALVCAAGVVALWLTRRDGQVVRGVLLALGYTALLVLSSSSTRFDTLDHPRFWLPVSPLLLALSARALASAHHFPGRRGLLALSVSVGALWLGHDSVAVAKQSIRMPARSGLFAQSFASSQAVQRALELFDQGSCALSAPHAFWLYSRIGTRPITWLTETGKALSKNQHSCVLLLRKGVEYNTDSAPWHAYLQKLPGNSHAQLLQSDAVAELWWLPPARDTFADAQRSKQP